MSQISSLSLWEGFMEILTNLGEDEENTSEQTTTEECLNLMREQSTGTLSPQKILTLFGLIANRGPDGWPMDEAENSPDQHRKRRKAHDVHVPKRKLECEVLSVPRLPPEMLARIFRQLETSDLCRAARVCHQWRGLIYHKPLWSDVTVTLNRLPVDRTQTEGMIDSLLLRDIRKLRTSSHEVLHEVCSRLPDLESLTLSEYPITGKTWSSSLLQQMSNVTSLEFSLVYDVTDDSVMLIAENLTKLQSLNLQNTLITNRSLLYIAHGLLSLKRLDLSNCVRIDDTGVGYLCGFGLDPRPAILPQLISILLENCSDESELSYLAIYFLSVGQPTLEELSLTYIDDPSNTVFGWLSTFRDLRRLVISGAAFDGTGLLALVNAESQLSKLVLDDCNELCNDAFLYAGQLQQLVTLSIKDCVISNAKLSKLVESGTKLRTLTMWDCSSAANDGPIGGAIAHVAKLTELRELQYRCSNVALAHLADADSSVASVFCAIFVTDVGLRHLSRLSKLVSVCLLGCKFITSEGFEQFVAAQASGTLAKLNLRGCVGLDSRTLSSVARGLPALTDLQLDYGHLGERGMVDAARFLSKLASITIDDVQVIDKVRRLRVDR